MKTLFFGIFALVFLAGHLIAPNTFTIELDNTQATPVASNSDTLATPLSGSSLNSAAVTPTAVPDEPDTIVLPRPATDIDTMNTEQVQDTDPESLFGEAKVKDTFDRGSSGFGLNAGLNDDDAIRIVALNNRLTLEPKKNNGWLSWRLRPPSFSDGAVEMEFSITTCARGDRSGIMLHAADYSDGRAYYVSLACEGTVSILRDSTVLASANASDAFYNNSGDVNKMTVISRDNNMTVLLNGHSILTVRDDTYPTGYSGFFTAPQEQGTLTMDVLSFNVYTTD